MAASLESLLGVGSASTATRWSLSADSGSNHDLVFSVAGRKYYAHAKKCLRGSRACGALQDAAEAEARRGADKKAGTQTTLELRVSAGTPDDADTFKVLMDFMYGQSMEAGGVLTPDNVTRVLLLSQGAGCSMNSPRTPLEGRVRISFADCVCGQERARLIECL